MTDEKRIDTDAWSQNQKDEILRVLMKERLGSLELDTDKGLGLLAFEQEIPARAVGTIQAPCYMTFKPHRLIIFEPHIETLMQEEIFEYKVVQRGHLWWKTLDKELVRRTSTPKCLAHKVSRSGWSIVGGFVGQRAIWPAHAAQPGDAFGIDNALCFDGPVCSNGLTVTLNVRNNTDTKQPFSAVMVGKYINESTVTHRKPFTSDVVTEVADS